MLGGCGCSWLRWFGTSPENLQISRLGLSLFIIDFSTTKEKDVLTTGDSCINLLQIRTWRRGCMVSNWIKLAGRFRIKRREPASE